MASKKKPVNLNSSQSRMNFRPSADGIRTENKGSKPLPEPASVQQILVMMIIHLCRKALFVDTGVKVAIYGGCIFILSLIADFIPMPKTYLATKENIFNLYFVKLGWGWTLLVTLPFIVLTSYTYCCGQRERMIKHLLRLLIATGMWYIWTTLFSYIEHNYGKCYVKNEFYSTKRKCINAGFVWRGLDVSGHAFLLIYSTLVIVEEAKAIIGWEGIGDLIRNEEYSRTNADSDVENSPLRNLTAFEFYSLKDSYAKFTPFVRGLFISMTVLALLWDVMLIGTILYHHIMIEKFVGGAIAILMWFFTYRYWFPSTNSFLCLPGDGGQFKYRDLKTNKDLPSKNKRSSSTCSHHHSSMTGAQNKLPKFMGMPLYGLNKPETSSGGSSKDENRIEPESIQGNSKWQPRRQDFFADD